jgi:hypothetical protein
MISIKKFIELDKTNVTYDKTSLTDVLDHTG